MVLAIIIFKLQDITFKAIIVKIKKDIYFCPGTLCDDLLCKDLIWINDNNFSSYKVSEN